MKNIRIKLSAEDVQKIVETHLNNELLGEGVEARVREIYTNNTMECKPGVPNLEMDVTFDT